MTRGPVQLDVGISYGLPRKGLPAAASFRKWAAAAAHGRIRKADLAIRLVATTVLPGEILRQRLRLLAGQRWEMRDVTRA